MNSKKRAKLRSIAMNTPAIFQLGENGITDNFINQIFDALRKRELVKITVLERSGCDIKEISGEIAEKTESEIVQIIGRKAIFFKENLENPVISNEL